MPAEDRTIVADESFERPDPFTRFDRLRSFVHDRDRDGELGQQSLVEFAAFRKPIERPILLEARHLDCPVDRLAGTVDRERTIGLACDRHQASVQSWREFAIDREFGLASNLALLQGREIEKRIADRALDLEREVAGEKDDRGMGLMTTDLCRAGKSIARRITQQRENGILRPSGRRLLHFQTISRRRRPAKAPLAAPGRSRGGAENAPRDLVPFNIADWLFSPALIDTVRSAWRWTWPDPLIPRLSTVIAGERPNALRSGSGPAGRLLSAYLNVKRAAPLVRADNSWRQTGIVASSGAGSVRSRVACRFQPTGCAHPLGQGRRTETLNFSAQPENSLEPRASDGVCVGPQKVRGLAREGVCRSVPRFSAAGLWPGR